MSIHDWGKGIARSLFEHNIPAKDIIEGEISTLKAWFANQKDEEFDEDFAREHLQEQLAYIGANPEEFGYRGYAPKSAEISLTGKGLDTE